MITNILLTSGYERGYLPKSESAMIQPVFATANLAIRRQALNEIGLFDVNCNTGEDVDLSIRLSRTKWELFFEPRAVIRHKHRTTLLGLLRQWFKYGKYHPYIFKKHTPRCLKVYYPDPGNGKWRYRQFFRVFGLPFPMHVLVFITPFHIFNALLALGMFSLFIKSRVLLAVSLILWLVFWLYFKSRNFFSAKKNCRWMAYSLIRYILNWAYVIGALAGGLRIGVIYIEATREQTPNPVSAVSGPTAADFSGSNNK